MTTIQSTEPRAENEATITPLEAEVFLSVWDPRSGRSSVHVNKAELLSALGAVDKARAEQAEAATARVEKVLHNHTCDGEDMTPFAQQIRAALTGKPFELPTTVPATIEARAKNGEYRELTLWVNGSCAWDGAYWQDGTTQQRWTPEGVMEHYTDHRLLEDQ